MLMMFRYVQVAEKELQAYLAEKDPTLRNIDQLIDQYFFHIPDSNSSDFSGIVQSARRLFCKTSILLSPRARRIDYGTPTSKLIAVSASNSTMFVHSELL